MVSRTFDRVWVAGTVLLISFISFSSQIFVVWPWLGRTLSIDLIQLLFPFNCLVFMVFWNYRLCVTTPPGSVPPGWRPDIGVTDGMEVKKGNHEPRFCKTCEHYKPPRTHHCRSCKTCVLKLDHHCPWIANCVGFYNQGHFIRFLIYVDLATSYHLMMLIRRVLELTPRFSPEPTLADVLFLVFNFAACAPVWLCVGMFTCYHLYLAAGNSTTIEGWEKDKVATLVRRGKIHDIKYPYNIGIIKNLKSVLGPNPLFWLWPQTMRNDGLSFPVNPDAGDSTLQYHWPPRDPSRLPNPPPPSASSSAFIYGNDGFNPALRPSNSSSSHARHRGPATPPDCASEGEGGSTSRGSSPEPYLSDYDDEGWGPADPDADLRRRMRSRVRQGSEGWEIRPTDWHVELNDVERRVASPWEDEGRYRLYEPQQPLDDGMDSDEWGDSDLRQPGRSDANGAVERVVDTKYPSISS